MKRLLAASVAALLALPILAWAAPPPKVSIALGSRHGHASPHRSGATHTAGGNIDVAQSSPDTVVITMTGVAVATGSPCGCSQAAMNFDLNQCFEVSFDDPKVKKAKLSIEGRVIGLLRSHCKGGGTAMIGDASASVCAGDVGIISLTLPGHAVSCGENLSINDKEGPQDVPVNAGKYTLRQSFSVQASHPRGLLGKAASAEFAPDAIDPLWISHREPFKGAAKKDFGFQITVTVAADDSPEEKKP